MEVNKTLEKVIDAVEEAIRPIIKKGEAMTAAELEWLTKSVCLIETIKKIQQTENEKTNGYQDSYSENSFGDNSYRRGRSAVTGRYVSRDSGGSGHSGYYNEVYDAYRNGAEVPIHQYDIGNNAGGYYRNYGDSSRRYYGSGNAGNYSGHSKHDRMIAALETMQDNAKTEHERQFVQEWLNRAKYQ